ncbi:uncharacterized protein LOC129795993 [Lutzomyia longipalpis]|uniref:uncharacterized protein LOC129795993 n=1 Tax=Lutzomyia longipalpis TaxID=7200 RepID=UPI00248445A1|nr:uncharacterized protein LOC129795993 [Lutzomyia longipalpis]
MVHYFELLAVRNNARFAMCWLAATNYSAFQNHVKKGHLQTIRVSNMCDEILKMLNSESQEPRERISLPLAAKLSYGIVKIHAKIADELLEEVLAALKVQSFVLKSLNFSEDTDEVQKPVKGAKKRQLQIAASKARSKRPKLGNSGNAGNALQLIEDLDDVPLEDTLNIPESSHTVSNELISLREVPSLPTLNQLQPLDPFDDFLEEADADEDISRVLDYFGSMNVSSVDTPLGSSSSTMISLPGPSRRKFATSTPLSMFKNFCGSMSKQGISSITAMNITMISANCNRMQDIFEGPASQEFHGFPETSNALPDAAPPGEIEVKPEPGDVDEIPPQLPEVPLELEGVQGIPGEDLNPPEVPEVNDRELQENVQEPQENLPNPAINDEFIAPPVVAEVEELTETPPEVKNEPQKFRGGKKRKIQQVDDVKMIPGAKLAKQVESSGKAVNFHRARDMAFRQSQFDKDFISRPLRKRVAEPLMDLFGRNCKIRRVTSDETMDILGEILMGSTLNNNRPSEDVMLPIMEDFNNFGNKRRTRKHQGGNIQQDIPLLLEEAPPPVIQAHQEVPGNFFEIPQEPRNVFQDDFTEEGVLTKLQNLWSRGKNPITMNTLLGDANGKKEAAKAFMSIMELVKQRKIKLHRNDANLEIIHIAPFAA